MTRFGPVIASMLAITICAGAVAQSALERQLAGALQSRDDKLDIEKTKRTPEWKLTHNGGASGKGCSITYHAGEQALGYLGPSADWNEAFVIVTGPAIPIVPKAVSAKVTMSTEGEPDRNVTATHLTLDGEKQGMIIFLLPSIEAGLDVMQDVEGVAVKLDKKPVFSLRWADGHAARDKMRACLAGTTG